MRNEWVEREWEDLCQRVRKSAEALGEDSPGRGDQFVRQAEDFVKQDVPGQYSEFLTRVKEAAEMAKSWSSSRASSQVS